MSGPRDWSPSGYWDETAPQNGLRRPRLLNGLVSVLLGVTSIFLPLAVVSGPGYSGWVISTVGVSAVGLAIRYRRTGGLRWLSMLGGALGVIGSILCAWSLASFYLSGAVPAAPSLRSETPASAVSAPPAQPPAQPGVSRAVPPFEGADVVPGNQLHANLVHVALALDVALQMDKSRGMLPSVLQVQPDGTVISAGATYSKIAPYMSLEYGVTAAGYTLAVRDTVSGMTVGIDPSGMRVVDQ